MKITFMGTSHGYAEVNRFTSATLIETGQYSYLLDAGAPVEWIMVNSGKSYDKIRGIFITHMHNDHVCSLSTVIEPMLRFRYNDRAVCYFPSESGKSGFLNWMKTLQASPEKTEGTVPMRITQAGEIFNNGDICVSATPTRHFGENGGAYSYTFTKDESSVLFTGDMGAGFSEYPTLLGNKRYSLVVCEMAHSKLADVAEMLKATDTERMVITHYYSPMLEGYEEIFKTFPFPVEIATDGMEIIL